jgi:hypothetical protein
MRKLLGAALVASALAAAGPALAADTSPVGQKECEKQGGTYLVREFPPPGYQCHDATVQRECSRQGAEGVREVGGAFSGPSPEQKPTYTCTYF